MSVELERETGDRLEGINQDKCCVTCYWDRQSKAICVKSTSKIFLAVAVISAIYVIASAIGIRFFEQFFITKSKRFHVLLARKNSKRLKFPKMKK